MKVFRPAKILYFAVHNLSKRNISGQIRLYSSYVNSKRDWWEIYHERKKKVYDNPNYTETRSDAVFANNEISLGDIDIYGFDYDYTLALYKPALHSLIYKLGGHALVENLKGPLMYQLVDLFAPPEMILLTNITDFFLDNNIPYDPEYVFHDVRSSVQGVHNSGALHSAIMQDLDTYVDKGNEIKALLESLVQNGKKLFLITNSGFPFVDAGMKFMVGQDWRDLFHVIITKARKPKFFNESSRPFRMLDPTTQNESYDRVYRLVQGKVYQQGNFYMLRQMTGWYSFNVLYFGDHVYSDLADPSLKSGWRTGAIIPELEKETLIMNSADYHTAVNWLGQLENLIEISQMDKSPETSSIRKQWLDERHELRNYTKSLFNPLFGSIFRTYHNPTYFTRRLARFADLYMSSVVNLMQYSPDHTFYPRRMALPHEPHNMDN